MVDLTLFKSLGASSITGGITETVKILLLFKNVSTENTLKISLIVSYTMAYVAQRYVFGGGRFFGISLLKYCSVALVTIQITNIFLNMLLSNETIKGFIEDTNISDTRRKIYKYLLINSAILTIFFGIEYPLRKSFIFIKNKITDYTRSYILYSLAIIIFLVNRNITRA